MWYVAQVQAGRESSTLEMCRRLVPPSVMEDCFMPEYEVMWKIRGEWRLVKRLLFPGYLFFVTDDPEALNRELSRVPMPIRLLGNEENSFFPLTGKERDWFLSFMDGNHTVRMSEGYISGDKITVTRGPLMGFEGDIRKIDRHKRRAYIDVSLFGRTVPASVGLENREEVRMRLNRSTGGVLTARVVCWWLKLKTTTEDLLERRHASGGSRGKRVRCF